MATIVSKMGILALSSVVLFLATTVVAQLLSKYVLVHLRYDSSNNAGVSLLKLMLTVSIISMCGFLVRMIPFMIPKTIHFDPINHKEMRGTVLVAGTFMLFVGDDLKTFTDFLKFV